MYAPQPVDHKAHTPQSPIFSQHFFPQTKHQATPALAHQQGDRKTDWQAEDVGLLRASLSPNFCCPGARAI